jgi:hypothetical protein
MGKIDPPVNVIGGFCKVYLLMSSAGLGNHYSTSGPVRKRIEHGALQQLSRGCVRVFGLRSVPMAAGPPISLVPFSVPCPHSHASYALQDFLPTTCAEASYGSGLCLRPLFATGALLDVYVYTATSAVWNSKSGFKRLQPLYNHTGLLPPPPIYIYI